jgi:hypothetical protein
VKGYHRPVIRGRREPARDRSGIAVRHLSLIVERAPAQAKAQYQLALAYQRSGKPEKAREHREIYDRLLAEQRAKGNGIRVGGE